jgi:hypothetical protein
VGAGVDVGDSVRVGPALWVGLAEAPAVGDADAPAVGDAEGANVIEGNGLEVGSGVKMPPVPRKIPHAKMATNVAVMRITHHFETGSST